MIFLRLYRFFVGKVKVVVLGDFAERILNLCANNAISVWGIRKRGGKITFFMSVRDFKTVRYVLRGSRLRLHILKKRGFPFIIERYKHRFGILVGIALFFFTLYFLSTFVWNITVSGNSAVQDETIIDACRQIGITEGVRKNKIDAWQKRVELMTQLDGLAWAAINIEGSVLTIDVTEAKGKEKDNETPSNLVANDNGKIIKIEVLSGITKVKKDDFVAKGQVLVSGVFELKDGTTQLTRSSGSVIAEVEKTQSVTVPFKQRIKSLNGNIKKRYVLSVFGLKIPLYLGKFSEDFVRDDYKLKISNGDYYVPIYLHCGEFRKVEEVDINLTAERAEELAKNKLKEKIKGCEVIKMEEKTDISDSSVTVSQTMIIKKDIAKEEILLISTTN